METIIDFFSTHVGIGILIAAAMFVIAPAIKKDNKNKRKFY